MNKSMMALSIMALVTMACGVCSYTYHDEWDPTTKTLRGAAVRGGGGVGGCTLPPETFQESDLVGTWVGAPGNTTLTLKEDYTYKQIYDNPYTGYHYESSWQEWWVEHRESGIPHLHLQGMKMCDYSTSEDCRRESGGTGVPWFDYCEGRLIPMRGEVILLTTGVSEQFPQPPRGIELNYLLPDPDSVSGAFQLQQ